MTVALAPARPAGRHAARPGGRHRLDAAGEHYFYVHPPRFYRPTSHRRSRRALVHRSIADLTRPHTAALAIPRPRRRYALAAVLAWLAAPVEPQP